MILFCLGTGCRFIVKTWCSTVCFCTVLVIFVHKVLRHQSPLSAVSLGEMLFHTPVSWILLNWLNSLCEGGGGVVECEFPSRNWSSPMLYYPLLPPHMSEEIFMPLAATFQALWNKLWFCGSPEHLTGLTAPWRRQDFAAVAILCRVVPGPVAHLHTTIALAELL